MNYKKYLILLSSTLLICTISCGCSDTDNKNPDSTGTLSVKDTTQTVENGNIKVTLENTYNKEFKESAEAEEIVRKIELK